MRRDGDRQKLFTRRAALLIGGKVALLSALAGRLYYLQVLESERYATLAEDNRINLRLLSPPRGQIVDRFGVPIAVNRLNYQAVIVPEQARDIERTLQALSHLVGLSDADRRRVLREVRRKRGFVPVTVRENLSWEEVAQIEFNAPDLPGVMIDVGQSRAYPFSSDLAHVVGYVAAVSERDADGDPLLLLPGFRVGKAGIERTYDKALRGAGGTSQVEVNAIGRVIRELAREEGQRGAEIKLTIDLELQKLAVEKLGEESGSVVLLDVHNGDILVMASSPSFDPNAFNRGLSGEEWRNLIGNPKGPLNNKAIAGQYAPGSTFKLVVAMAALERGLITPSTRVFCSGAVELGDAKFHCWKKGGHGLLELQQGIMHSCDVYFYEVARRLGVDRIAAMARRFGFGEPTGIELPGEVGGLIPSRDWKEAFLGSSWQRGETLILGIGQGYILSTPLQLAVMTARLVNGGFAVVPRLTREELGSAGSVPRPNDFESLGVAPQHLAVVAQGAKLVVNNPSGTAYRSRIAEAGLEMGGKTGTVQVRRITKAERETGIKKNEDLPWHERDHALFVGFAPVDAPRYAVAVVIEHGGGGSKVAAPIARDILLAAQRRDQRRDRPVREISERAPAPGAGVARGG